MIRFKDGVKINGISAEVVMAIMVAEQLYTYDGLGITILTSVVEGNHSVGSLHYIGHAFDIRTARAGLSQEQAEGLAEDLRRCLTDEFDVVVEDDHIHVEFQPKTH